MPDAHVHIQYCWFKEPEPVHEPGTGTVEVSWVAGLWPLAQGNALVPVQNYAMVPDQASIAVSAYAMVYESICKQPHTPVEVLEHIASMLHCLQVERQAWTAPRKAYWQQLAWAN